MNLIIDGGEAESAVCSVGDECSSAPRGPLLHDKRWSPVRLSVSVTTTSLQLKRGVYVQMCHTRKCTQQIHRITLSIVYKERKMQFFVIYHMIIFIFSSFC